MVPNFKDPCGDGGPAFALMQFHQIKTGGLDRLIARHENGLAKQTQNSLRSAQGFATGRRSAAHQWHGLFDLITLETHVFILSLRSIRPLILIGSVPHILKPQSQPLARLANLWIPDG